MRIYPKDLFEKELQEYLYKQEMEKLNANLDHATANSDDDVIAVLESFLNSSQWKENVEQRVKPLFDTWFDEFAKRLYENKRNEKCYEKK